MAHSPIILPEVHRDRLLLFLLHLVDLNFARLDRRVAILDEVAALGEETLRADPFRDLLQSRQDQRALLQLGVLGVQIAKQKLKSVCHALVADAQPNGGKQFHPLDEHLADGLLAKLEEHLSVHLIEVGGRDQRQQALQVEEEGLPLLAGAA